MQMRPYQTAAIGNLRARIRAGDRRVLLVSPTGSGKTVIAAEMIRSALLRGGRILFLAHRRELIQQCSAKLDALSVDHGVVMAQHPRWRPHAHVQVASVQTLVNRLAGTQRPPATLIFVDEAHHARAATYGKILDQYPEAVTVGLTATPWRGDGKGLGDMFQSCTVAATVAELTAGGSLVPAVGFGYETPDLKGVRTTGGDYNLQQLDAVMDAVILTGDMVAKWREHCGAGRRTVVFAVNVRHSRAIVDQFQAAGVTAEHLDANTPTAERDATLARLASGETTLVSNVGILTEGWDSPRVEVLVLARPTKSLTLAMQMMGRVLRPAPGKTVARIHDHAGVMLQPHIGAPDEERDYSLTADKPKGLASGKTCPRCLRYCAAATMRCPECGYDFREAATTGQQREILTVNGVVLDIEDIRARRRALGLTRVLTPEQAARVVSATRAEKAAEYLRLREVCCRKGFGDWFVANQYRETFGVWPKFSDDELAGAEPARWPFIPLPPRARGAA